MNVYAEQYVFAKVVTVRGSIFEHMLCVFLEKK